MPLNKYLNTIQHYTLGSGIISKSSKIGVYFTVIIREAFKKKKNM